MPVWVLRLMTPCASETLLRTTRNLLPEIGGGTTSWVSPANNYGGNDFHGVSLWTCFRRSTEGENVQWTTPRPSTK